jgi:hypothetical protein
MNQLKLILILVIFVGKCFCQERNVPQIKHGLEAMQNIQQLPLLFPNGVETKQFISYDPTGKNWDFDFSAAFTKYVDSTKVVNDSIIKEYVIFDEYGPGCLYRQQMNTWLDQFVRLDSFTVHTTFILNSPRADANIRYYFDNEEQPRIDMHLNDFFGGTIKPFNEPLCFIEPMPRFSISYYPFQFRKRLKVTLKPHNMDFDKILYRWYQYTYLSYPSDSTIETWNGAETVNNKVRSQWTKNGDNPNDLNGCRKLVNNCDIKKNESKTIFEVNNHGSITGLKIFIKPYCQETFFNTNIKIYWDGDKKASVDLPLCYLFGGGAKDYSNTSEQVFQKSLTTLMYGFNKEEGSFYSYWPMPFWKSAKIILENNSGINISNLTCEVLFKSSDICNYSVNNSGYFCAKRTTDTSNDSICYRGVAFEEKGRGHVAGIMFYSDNYDQDGDEFTYIDDSKTPQIHGDGTEDDHNQGWGGDAYQKPLWGGVINGYQGGYRIYLNDCYIFNKNILIAYEYSLCNEPTIKKGGSTDVIVYYYKSKNGENLHLTDEIDIGSNYSEKSHQYMVSNQTWKGIIKDAYDGYERNLEYGTSTDDGRANRGFSKFTATINPENQGVKIRKRINRKGNGVQTAEVYVDGVKVKEKPWHIVTPSLSTGEGGKDDFDGWLDSDFEIPVHYTKSKDKITIEIKYIDSPQKKEINEFYYWVYSYNDNALLISNSNKKWQK